MDLLAGYEFHTPTAQELDAVAQVVIADELHSTGHITLGADFVRGEWSQAGFDLATDAWAVVGADGEIVGYGQVRLGDSAVAGSWGSVHPAHRGNGIGSALFSRIEQRAATMLAGLPSSHIRHAIYANDQGAAAILRAAGLRPVRHFWHMQIDLTEALAPAAAPQEVQIGGIELPEGLKAVYEVINEALAEHWDHHQQPFERWLEEESSARGYNPALWLLATQDGRPAGALTASIGEDRGWIDYLGVLPAHRGKGIAAALLHRAFAAFAARGVPRALVSVDANNATGATAVYERAGMRVVKAWDIWEVRRAPATDPEAGTPA